MFRAYLVRDADCPAGFKPFMIDDMTGTKLYTRMEDNGDITVAEVQPAQMIIDQNQKDRYSGKGTFTQKGKWGTLAARVPISQLNQWFEDGNEDQIMDDVERSKILKTKLNDGDYSKFRVCEFSV